jgi:galactose mutarotase-like enzyme
VIAGELPWELLERTGAEADRADVGHVHARLAWHSPKLLAIFPYRHTVEFHARLAGARLTITTTVRADGGCAVPVSFGFHPYLTIGGTDRIGWRVELPVADRLLLDERMIPTAPGGPLEPLRFALSDGNWDDALTGLDPGATFAVSAAARRIELRFEEGYSQAQIYAPPQDGFICFEPMTAPTNALITHRELPVISPSEAFHASFSVAVV